jgi:hypothetical protein
MLCRGLLRRYPSKIERHKLYFRSLVSSSPPDWLRLSSDRHGVSVLDGTSGLSFIFFHILEWNVEKRDARARNALESCHGEVLTLN